MSAVETQVARARRRLLANVLWRFLALGVLVAAAAWSLTLFIERALVSGLPLGPAAWVAAAVALLIALLGTAATRVTPLRAAATLDAATGLKERLSTAVALRASQDPFARAAIHDAEQAAGRIRVPSHVRYRAPELWPWSCAAVVTAVLLALFMPRLDLLAESEPDDQARQRQLADAERRAIDRELESHAQQLREMAQNNPALQDALKDLEPPSWPDKPTATPEDVRRDAAKRIDKVADRLAAEKDKLADGALRETQRLLARLQPQPGQTPAAELSQALVGGDFQSAREALEQLQQELKQAAANGDPEAQQSLQAMQEQLQRLAHQLARLDNPVALQKELEKKAGLSADEARKLAEALAGKNPQQLEQELQRALAEKGLSPEQSQGLIKKVQQQRQAGKTCQNLSQCLARAAEAIQQCNTPGGQGSDAARTAAAALSDAANRLSQLEMSKQSLNKLEARLADLNSLRESICQGGCLEGAGDASRRQAGDRTARQGKEYGLGHAARVGSPPPVPHALQPIHARTRARPGPLVGQMLIDGPLVRGEATVESREAVISAQRDAQDAIDRDVLPRQYHAAVRSYFERLAGLIAGSSPPAAEPPAAEPRAAEPPAADKP